MWSLNMAMPQNQDRELDLTEEEIRQQIERAEEAELKRVTEELEQAIDSDPELAGLGDNLRVDRTPEGVRIQIVDQDQRSMFPLGRGGPAALHRGPDGQARDDHRPHRPADLGDRAHRRDPVPGRQHDDNWQLSSDRANASRRALIAAGLPEARISRVVGQADTEPLDPAHPDAAQNRRISIVLLRQPTARGSAPAPDER